MSEIKITKAESYPFLSLPVRITQQKWPVEVPSMVSISCKTYMHENYIRDTIDGFLIQECNFKVEILIHDDASTDKTADVVREYELKYPQLFKNTYQVENQFRKNPRTEKYVTPHKRTGKYVARCEGDDFWTDPLKLQKMVSFMEENPDFSICHHNLKLISEIPGEESCLINPPDQPEVSTIYDLAKGNFIGNASCLFRNGLYSISPEWVDRAPIGDYVSHMLVAQYGKIKYFREVMGVYRVHKGGIWQSKDVVYRFETLVALLDLMKNHFSPEVNDLLKNQQKQLCETLLLKVQDDSEKIRYYSNKLIEIDPFYIIKVKNELSFIRVQSDKEIMNILSSFTYKFGRCLLLPLIFLADMIKGHFKKTEQKLIRKEKI